ncbi:hypothetical protein ACPUER_27895, partial [Burkholderia sp. DN3021]
MGALDYRPRPASRLPIHMMFDGPTTAFGHDPPDVSSHAASVLPLRSGSPVRPLPPGGRRRRAPAPARRPPMSRLLSIARGVAAVGAVAAYQAGAHYAAATPGAHGFG